MGRTLQPLFLGGFISYFDRRDGEVADGNGGRLFLGYPYVYVCAAGIMGCAMLSIVVNHPFVLYTTHLGIKVRLTCCAMIYRKVCYVPAKACCLLHLRARLSLQVQKKIKSATVEGFNGKVINLMSNDLATFDKSVYYVHLLWKGPIEMLIFGYFIYGEIGYYGWIGIGFISCFVPIQSNRSSDDGSSPKTNPFGFFQCGWDEWPRNTV